MLRQLADARPRQTPLPGRVAGATALVILLQIIGV